MPSRRSAAASLFALAAEHDWSVESTTRVRRRGRILRTTKVRLRRDDHDVLILEHTAAGAPSGMQTLVLDPKVYWLYAKPTVRDAIVIRAVPRDAVEARLDSVIAASV